jgi:hypothetical protein
MTTGKVAVILLNWNGKVDTLDCLESLQRVEYAAFEVIVVDNGSQDDSVAVIRARYPSVTVLETGANLGFSAGNNVGIIYALGHGADYILLLNNDTVVDPQLLAVLTQTSQNFPDSGFLGAKIYFFAEPRRIWYAGARWFPYKADFEHIGGNQIDNGVDWEKTEETAYACGCALFVRREVIESIGMLEPSFFALWEECDWCYRAQRQGFKTLFVPDAKVWHKVSASFSGGAFRPHYQYYYSRNRLLWIERNQPWREKIRLYRRVILKDIVQNLRCYFNQASAPVDRLRARAGLIGVGHYFMRRFGPAPDWLASQPQL